MQHQQIKQAPIPPQQPSFVVALQQAKDEYNSTVSKLKLPLIYQDEAIYAHTQIARTADKGRYSLEYAAPDTVMESLIMAAKLHLTLNPRKNHAYLIPRWNGALKQLDCHLDISYRGFQFLAASCGAITRADAVVVYTNDKFEYHGTRKDVVHSITTLSTSPEARGQMAGAYCVAELSDGSICTTVMSPEEILAVESAALKQKNGGFSPWKGPFRDEMIKKSVIRRAWKQWEMLVVSEGGNQDLMKAVSNLVQTEEIDVTPQPESPVQGVLQQSTTHLVEGQQPENPTYYQ